MEIDAGKLMDDPGKEHPAIIIIITKKIKPCFQCFFIFYPPDVGMGMGITVGISPEGVGIPGVTKC